MDVSRWPALATAIRDRSSASAVSASELGSLGGRPGFYLLDSGSFGHGPNSRGYLVVFVPQGWLTASTGGDPGRLAVSLDGRHLEGFDSPPARSASFGMLGRRWRIDVATAPLTGLQTLLPWLAIAWPIAAALIAVLVGRGIARRRRAEREVERIFDLSLDLLCIADLDGHFKRVNPAFERTLGYTTQQLLSRPFLDFVHPDDRARTVETMEILERGEKLVQFENRYMCSDGSARWLQWSTRPMPDEGLLYAAARDVTDRRRAADELRETQRMVEASRDELRLLADEQAALRRVATLVAQGVSATEVFDAVAAEMCELLGADSTHLLRYESDGTATVVAVNGDPGVEMAAGTRMALAGEHAASRSAPDCLAALRHLGLGSELGEPIVVEGRPWGVMVAAWTQQQPVSAGAEARMAQFTELMATAIANGEARTEVAASRARIVAAADEERRRVVRDLHDGAQQRLVHTVITLKLARRALQRTEETAPALLTEALDHAEQAMVELRELSHGILPAVLTRARVARRGGDAGFADAGTGRDRRHRRPAPRRGRGDRLLRRRRGSHQRRQTRSGSARRGDRARHGRSTGRPGARRRHQRRPGRRDRLVGPPGPACCPRRPARGREPCRRRHSRRRIHSALRRTGRGSTRSEVRGGR